MTGTLIVNNLAGLLIISSLLVIGAKQPKNSALFYALQSFILVLVFIALAYTVKANELYAWAATAFITKVLLVPYIMYQALGTLKDERAVSSLSLGPLLLIASAIVILSYQVVATVKLPMVEALKPALSVSLGHFFLGLLCIVSQRNILKQIFGYCLMENGAHLTLAIMANKAPKLVEIGIATDAIFAVVIMSLLARKIYRMMNSLDVQQLTALKG
jgi:hydrogenase-4 component E